MNFKDKNTNFCVATEVVKHKFDKKLKEQFFYSHKLPNHDKNKFFWLLQQGVYPYEYMHNWE